jgi:glyoxylase-like metal-dependent hydrolase (beta-lactamase superfamily II)
LIPAGKGWGALCGYEEGKMPNRFSVGDIEVIAVSDGEIWMVPTEHFLGTTDEQWSHHARWLSHDGLMRSPLGCFVIRSGGQTVLIDTGLGPFAGDGYRGGDLLSELEAAQVRRDEIDTVFITHLHVDHCGTAALREDAALRPAFPRATYRWTVDEQAYWSGPESKGQIARKDIFAAIAPQWQGADGGASLAPGVDVLAMPGHTPGHAGVVISSGDQRAFILGDGISCPAQLSETEWSSTSDVDPALARRMQEAIAREVEGSGALLGTSHFPGLTLGRVLMGEGKRYWQPA